MSCEKWLGCVFTPSQMEAGKLNGLLTTEDCEAPTNVSVCNLNNLRSEIWSGAQACSYSLCCVAAQTDAPYCSYLGLYLQYHKQLEEGLMAHTKANEELS